MEFDLMLDRETSREVNNPGVPVYHVDAFTREPFKGNPAVVILVDRDADDSKYQATSTELNPVSETAFLAHMGGDEYGLRWFTPTNEIRLCGHATLATAHVVFNELKVVEPEIRFQTLSGTLKAVKSGKAIRLDFPRDNPTQAEAPSELLEELGIKHPKDVVYGPDNRYLVVVAESEAEVREAKPDPRALLGIELPLDIVGVAVTSEASGRHDIVSRFFAPWLGINEDPVTGSLHTILTPYWVEKLGKEELIAYQASPRTGEMTLSQDNERVYVTGEAITILQGNLRIDPTGG
jgi:PhzF family phenazine biosynthesis protein